MKHNYLIFFLFFFTTTGFAQALEQDRLALVALYNSTIGANWYNNTGWAVPGSPGDNPCGWYGVTCEGGRVTGLNLSNNMLTGTLPLDLGNLSALKILDLDQGIGLSGDGDLQLHTGWIRGALPVTIGNLNNLEYLDLGGNFFKGSIPGNIGNLVKLRYLDISYTPEDAGFDPYGLLTGVIPSELGNLLNLIHLDLHSQNLNGPIPLGIVNMLGLEYLNLSYNDLSGVIPQDLGRLSKLLFLDLSFWGYLREHKFGLLSGDIPDLSDLPSSAYVYVYGNSFTFNGMETNISRLKSYSNQAKIPMYGYFPLSSSSGQGGMLFVEAGGILANNTYKWYKNGVLVASNIGIPYFNAYELGTFRVEVTNSIATELKLVSDNYTVSPLPVTLTSFLGKTSSIGNFLTWQTTTETTNKGFEIERSKDAINFENVGFIDGNGDSKATNDYGFLDRNPFPLSYYRLKQIDYDGKFEYSRIIYLKKDNSVLSVYPNPAKDQLFVSGLEKEESITIHNIDGRKVIDQKISSFQPINTSTLSNGLYIIKIGDQTSKLVIQN